MDDIELLSKLLARPEGNDLDFKATRPIVSDPKHKAEFIKDLISMANTPRNGSAFIVSGVKCKPDGTKEIIGVSDHPDDANLQELISRNVEPIPHFQYRPVLYGKKSLGILEIYPRRDGPFMPRFDHPKVIEQGTVYFRRGSSNAAASSLEFREIIEWMRLEKESSRRLRFGRQAYVDVGGALFDYPCFFPSISSLRTQLTPLGYLQILRASTYPWFLISAYDIHHAEGTERERLGELLKETLAGRKVLLDCGYYESSWKNDKEWTEERFWEVARSHEFSLAFNFDENDRATAASEDRTVKDVVARWIRDSDATAKGNLVPIVHAEAAKIPRIVQRVVQTVKSTTGTLLCACE